MTVQNADGSLKLTFSGIRHAVSEIKCPSCGDVGGTDHGTIAYDSVGHDDDYYCEKCGAVIRYVVDVRIRRVDVLAPKQTKARAYRCGWCAWQGDSWPAVADHVACDCPKAKPINEQLKKIAELVKHTAEILEHKTCPVGEEPLGASLDNLTRARDELAEIIERRDLNLKGLPT